MVEHPPHTMASPSSASLWSRWHTRKTAQQTTLKQAIHCRGIGLHTGLPTTMHLRPAAKNTGLQFQRLDLPGTAPFRLTAECVIPSPLATVATSPADTQIRVGTIEHLLAALHACQVDNLLIQLDGPELPILDGCSAAFSFLLDSAGYKQLSAPRRIIKVRRPVYVTGKNGAYAQLIPHKKGELDLSLTVDFPAPAIGKQSFQLKMSRRNFDKNVAFCRTFVNYDDVKLLRKQGLALGGSLDNALVIKHDKVLNPGGFRRQNECVRHKLLDTIGDLYCAGYSLSGHFVGHKTGHALNNQLLRALLSTPSHWQFSDSKAPSHISSDENITLNTKNPLPPTTSHAIRKSWSAAS